MSVLAGKSLMWLYLKHYFWWLVFLVVELVFLTGVAVASALLLGAHNVRNAVVDVTRAVLWGKAALVFTVVASMVMVLAMPHPVRMLPSQVDPLSWASLLNMPANRASIMFAQAHGPVVLFAMALTVWILQMRGVVSLSRAVVVALFSHGSWALLMAWGGPKLILLLVN
ncbi:hypothetical protein [Paucibacter sp. B51]|uniref:hypothetical protein n=1 Tax=Paucibacter sp. B51 TaxID=2993315 RepID=UPI0022EBFD21|nr:hypothetical protein [Paucibacter sp. B51]